MAPYYTASIALFFTMLPPETRNKIYGYVLGARTIHFTLTRVCHFSISHEHEQTSSSKDYLLLTEDHQPLPPSTDNAVLRICKQLHWEASPLFFGETTFKIKVCVAWYSDQEYLRHYKPKSTILEKLRPMKNVHLILDGGRYPTEILVAALIAGLRCFFEADCRLAKLGLRFRPDSCLYWRSTQGAFTIFTLAKFHASLRSDFSIFTRPLLQEKDSLALAVSVLGISKELSIQLHGPSVAVSGTFEDFVSAIKAVLGHADDLNHNNGLNLNCSYDEEIYHSMTCWNWVLRPSVAVPLPSTSRGRKDPAT